MKTQLQRKNWHLAKQPFFFFFNKSTVTSYICVFYFLPS